MDASNSPAVPKEVLLMINIQFVFPIIHRITETLKLGSNTFFASGSWENPDKCSNGYSLTDLACTGNVVSGFTTINSTSDFAKPNGPNEFVDYNLYK